MTLHLDLDFARFAPERFFFGVANAPYLCEGGYNTPDGPKNSYGWFEAEGLVPVSGETTRFWTDHAEHVRRARALGLGAFRTGIDWSRVQPTYDLAPGDPPAWDDAVAHYADILAEVHGAGMESIVTLHHFTHPAWLGRRLWDTDHGPDLLVDFQLRVVEEVNDHLAARGLPVTAHLIAFNELNLVPLIYFYGGLSEPGDDATRLARLAPAYDRILSRYVRIYDGLHDLFERRGWPTPRVGFGTASLAYYEMDRFVLDVVRLRTHGAAREEANAVLSRLRATWVGRMDALAARQLTDAQHAVYRAERDAAAAFLDVERLPLTLDALYASPRARKLDYLSANVYEPFGTARALGDARRTIVWDEFTLDPGVYGTFIRAYHDANDGLPLYMGENSIAYHMPVDGPARPRPDGWTRERYLKTYLMEMIACMAEGVPIEGYLYWSLVDDFEWENGFPPRLGLYAYDYPTHTIRETDGLGEPAADVYAHLVAALQSGDKERIQRAFVRSFAAERAAAGGS
jgi:beta-glucosidase/6-phospho-beta-glucosidase/beta-galactosidase